MLKRIITQRKGNLMDIILFALVESAIVILPLLWLKKTENREDQERFKRQQYEEWTKNWIPIQYHTTIKGEWVA